MSEEKLELMFRMMEYEFAASQYKDLMAAQQSLSMQLKQKPKDIQLTLALEKVNNDMNQLSPIIQASGGQMISHFETEYGLKFRFLKQDENDKTPKEKRDNFLKRSK